MQILNKFVRKRTITHFKGIQSIPQAKLVLMLSMYDLRHFGATKLALVRIGAEKKMN